MLISSALGALFALTGCDPVSTTDSRNAPKPLAGKALTVSCPDAAFADAITPIANTWAARTGATVTISRTPMTATDSADVGVIPSGTLAEWGEVGLLAPVPVKMRTGDQWQGLLPAYSERLSEWGGQTLAVPLTGDGYVVVYRADRFADKTVSAEFQKRYGRAPTAPDTWEAFADLATFFAEYDKKPSLPALPADSEQMFDLFCRVAASADRRALNDVELANRTAINRDALAFQFSVVSGKPRLQQTEGGFLLAAKWLDRLRAAKAFPAPGAPEDPVKALAEDRAVFALVALDQLSKLPRENGAIPPRFAIAGVPGTRQYHDPFGPKLLPGTEVPLNYVPYFAGGRLGVVRTRCQHQDAAFELLAELGSPARGAELVATPGLGAGPLRGAHLDRDRIVLWLGYGFDEERSKQLQDAMRQYVGQSVKNPALVFRGPDRAAVVTAVADPLRKLAVGGATPDAALKQANDAWNALDEKVPADTLLRRRQRAAGLN